MIPNAPGTDDVAGVAKVPLVQRDADVVHFLACPGWSDRALLVDEPAARRPGTAPVPLPRCQSLKIPSGQERPTNPCETEVSSGDALAPSPEKMGQAPRGSVSQVLRGTPLSGGTASGASPDGGAWMSVCRGNGEASVINAVDA